jgi:pantoate--beta-alanine ligase
MGALHDGHVSLIRRARRETDFVVVSIFVNPTQFGPNEDFDHYPRTFAADRRLTRAAGADLIYAPAASEMYPEGFGTYVQAMGDLAASLEGASRPGFFRGVATVVAKLLNQVQPDAAYFGQKDAQQARVIQRMVCDLDIPVRIVVCPTVREADGLAMSSRNRYLSADERKQATVLSQALKQAEELLASGVTEASRLKRAMRAVIRRAPAARIDYVEVVDAETLEPLHVVDRPALVALAVFIGTTRLIDNTILHPKPPRRRRS